MPASLAARAVDSHVHVFSVAAPAVEGARYRPAYAARLDAVQQAWRAHGVTHAVLVQPSFFGLDNTEMLEALATDREHLRGVAVVDPSASDAALGRLADSGVVALRLNLKGVDDYASYGEARWMDLYARAHRLGWHLECYTDAGRLPEIAAALEGSDIAVVFDHFGNPGFEERTAEATFAAIARLSASRFVGCKLSGPYRLEGADRQRTAARWMDITGPAHLVWGSDWPWTGFEDRNDYRRLHEDLARWVGAALAPAILWDNAARLYRFD
jgi:predicted TIM-barrel fold metal-dependent hydrolase